MIARRPKGETATYAPALNHHEAGQLEWSVIPAPVPAALTREATVMGTAIAKQLDVVGLLAVEMFVTRNGELRVNELAPRPHNSFHHTVEACVTSQFEQLVRAVCDLPLGTTDIVRPAAIANILGDAWRNGRPPDFSAALSVPGTRLHLYGKRDPRPARKMGHMAAVGATPEEALAHPTWNMGPKITVDSATLANKGLELIEAHFLFGLPYERIEVIVHPTSIVHSLVRFRDGAALAHLGYPDMRVPISFALSYPDRAATPIEPLDLAEGLTLEFEAPDVDTFPMLGLARQAGELGGTYPCAFNAANEVAVAAFLEGRLPFLGIPEVVGETLEATDGTPARDRDDLVEADAQARRLAERGVFSGSEGAT